MQDQIIELIKEWRAESERRWSPTRGYKNDHDRGYAAACDHHADDLEKLLKADKEG